MSLYYTLNSECIVLYLKQISFYSLVLFWLAMILGILIIVSLLIAVFVMRKYIARAIQKGVFVTTLDDDDDNDNDNDIENDDESSKVLVFFVDACSNCDILRRLARGCIELPASLRQNAAKIVVHVFARADVEADSLFERYFSGKSYVRWNRTDVSSVSIGDAMTGALCSMDSLQIWSRRENARNWLMVIGGDTGDDVLDDVVSTLRNHARVRHIEYNVNVLDVLRVGDGGAGDDGGSYPLLLTLIGTVVEIAAEAIYVLDPTDGKPTPLAEATDESYDGAFIVDELANVVGRYDRRAPGRIGIFQDNELEAMVNDDGDDDDDDNDNGCADLNVAYFLSDHGYGHGARSSCVIEHLLDRGARVAVCTGATLLPFLGAKVRDFERAHVVAVEPRIDVGVYQVDALEIDVARTGSELDALFGDSIALEQRVRSVAERLERWLGGAGGKRFVVVFDVPMLAALVAVHMGAPSVAVSNFDWQWLYGTLGLDAIATRFGDGYASTDALLRLPYASDKASMAGFPIDESRKFDVPAWLAPRCERPQQDTRAALGLDASAKLMLLSFGGHRFPIDDAVDHWHSGVPEHWQVVLIARADNGLAPLLDDQERLPANVRVLAQQRLDDAGVKYSDLVAACDTLVAKTGYGIVAEACVNRVPFIYCDRSNFAEHADLVRALHLNVPSACAELHDIVNLRASLFATADTLHASIDTFEAELDNNNGEHFIVEFLLNRYT
jgi:hypothetical protein